MGDILPAADVRMRDAVHFDPLAADASSTTRPMRDAGLTHRVFHFADIDNNDDWADPRGVVAVAWQANTVDDIVGPRSFTTGGLTGIRVATAATNPDGWLHVLSRGSQDYTATNDETPVQKGTAGYVPPGSLFLSHRAAVPNTLTSGRLVRKEGLKRQSYPFTLGSTSDRWVSQTGRLCPGIVAVAWQPAGGSDAVAVTQDADGDVIFTGVSSAETGWLWVFRRGTA